MADDMVDLKAGDRVWYVRPLEAIPRPAVILSDGIYETRKLASGQLQQFAHLAYGTSDQGHQLLGHAAASGAGQLQTHETSCAWDPTGAAGTFHLDDECPHLQHPKRANEGTQAP